MTSLSHKQNDWLEPMKEWIKDAQTLDGIARDDDLFAKKVKAKEIFGSTLLLGEKLVRPSAQKILNSLGKFGGNPWDALRASRILASKKPMSSLMVPGAGLGPASPCERLILSQLRLPISPPGLDYYSTIKNCLVSRTFGYFELEIFYIFSLIFLILFYLRRAKTDPRILLLNCLKYNY